MSNINTTALALLNNSRAERRYSASPVTDQFSHVQMPSLITMSNGFDSNNDQEISVISNDNQFDNIVSDVTNYVDPSSNFSFEEHNNGFLSHSDEIMNSVDF